MKILSTLKAFYKYISSQGLDKNLIYEEKGEGFVVVSFPEKDDMSNVYDIAIVFYDNNDDIEIYVRKPIKDYDELTLLRKINTLNCEYSAATFLVDNNMLTVKSHISSQGKLKRILAEMLLDVQLAQKEFVKM